jgi:hypothetical protein
MAFSTTALLSISGSMTTAIVLDSNMQPPENSLMNFA